MADTKWIKVAVDMFNDPKLKIINSMEEKDLINYIWMKSLLLAGQSNMNGSLYINETMPYTIKTLTIEFDRSLEDVKLAFKVLRKLEMIEITEDRIFKVKNWAKHQNVDELEKLKKQNRERVAKHRANKKELENNNVTEVIRNENNSNSETVNAKNGDNIPCKSNELINAHNAKYDECNNSNTICNITNDEYNITVMEQNKKEIKSKKKNKRETDKRQGNTRLSSGKEHEDNPSESIKTSEIDNFVLNSVVMKLLQHYEQVTGIPGGLDVGNLRLTIKDHGEDNVRKAIDKAIETGKTKANMRYINGILKNWRKEGYPEDDVGMGGINNGAKSNGEGTRSDSKQFKQIKPKKCRELTEEQRKNLGADLV